MPSNCWLVVSVVGSTSIESPVPGVTLTGLVPGRTLAMRKP